MNLMKSLENIRALERSSASRRNRLAQSLTRSAVDRGRDQTASNALAAGRPAGGGGEGAGGAAQPSGVLAQQLHPSSFGGSRQPVASSSLSQATQMMRDARETAGPR